MHAAGLVLHPQRDSAAAVEAVLGWATNRGVEILGISDEIQRLRCEATPVSAEELGRRADLVVSLGGDGTMLRAMRLADGEKAPVLGVNLGKLGFLAEVDVPDLPAALSAIDAHAFTVEPRLAVDAIFNNRKITAFNDIALCRIPGDGLLGKGGAARQEQHHHRRKANGESPQDRRNPLALRVLLHEGI